MIQEIGGLLKEFMLDDNESEEEADAFGREKVDMHHWARNRRQKVLRDISFESGSPHNIYDPHFSSQE